MPHTQPTVTTCLRLHTVCTDINHHREDLWHRHQDIHCILLRIIQCTMRWWVDRLGDLQDNPVVDIIRPCIHRRLYTLT